MQDSLKYLYVQFGYDGTKNKLWRLGGPMDLFNLQKAQPF